MGSHNLTEEAYLTILLHAAKHPSCAVCGLLLGEQQKGLSKAVTVSAAIPLFHLSMLLAPCVETALAQVDAYAEQQGLVLVGYYHAEARFDASDVHPVGKRIADRIADRQPNAFMVVLDNQKLEKFSREGSHDPPFSLYLRDASGPKSSWKKVQQTISSGLSVAGDNSWEQLQARYLNMHQAGKHKQLADFDEHLDDLSQDYTNAGLLTSATEVVKR